MVAKRFLLGCLNAISLYLAGLLATGYDVSLRDTQRCTPSMPQSGLLLVSTMDGELTALEHSTGRIIWKMTSNGPLLSSSLGQIKSASDLKQKHYVPSLDGKLFQWHGDRVEALPMSASLLLGKSFRAPDGMQVVGSSDISTFGVDPKSGKLQYICDTTGCKPANENTNNLDEMQMLILKRNQQTVRSFDGRTGAERWNFSVGTYEIDFIEGLDNHLYATDYYSFDYEDAHIIYDIKFDIPKGEVFAVDSNDDVKWSTKLKTPIAASWQLRNNSLRSLDLFDNIYQQQADSEDKEIMYLGIFEGQMYMHQPDANSYRKLRQNSDNYSHETDIANVDLPYIGSWRPYVSSSPSRTPFLNTEKGLTAFNSLDYPYDNGFYIVGKTNPNALQIRNKEIDSCINKETQTKRDDECTEDINADEDNDGEMPNATDETFAGGLPGTVIPLSLRDWWKEILVVSAVISLATNLIFRWAKRKFTTEIIQADDDVTDVGPKLKRSRTVTSSVSTATEVPQLEPIVNSVALSASTASLSRYNSEFEHVQFLGKGGFGAVFRAKNKVDDCEYAVKRICLPNCSFAKEKVMREVKALARLDHPGIVRYFNSWWEAASEDLSYEDQQDMMHMTSTALSDDWYKEVQSLSESKPCPTELKSFDSDGVSQINNSISTQFNRLNNIGTNPIGNQLNFQHGFDDLPNLKNFDLKNDVFATDDDDSFIEFESHSESNGMPRKESGVDFGTNTSNSLDGEQCHQCNGKLTWTTLDGSSCSNCISKFKRIPSFLDDTKMTQSKRRTKVVGRCCEKSADCLTAVPLHLYIQMQLCRKETLREWLNDTCGARTRAQALAVFNQIVLAVEYFHSQGMMHRDLKPKNIFFTMDYAVKVGDFGLVTAVMRPSDGQAAKGSAPGEGHTGKVGTELYMSPEQVYGKAYSYKVDIYSLGLILFELLLSFKTEMERVTNLLLLRQGKLPEAFEKECPQEASFIKWLISEDPKQRPEASEIKDSPMLNRNNCDPVIDLTPDNNLEHDQKD